MKKSTKAKKLVLRPFDAADYLTDIEAIVAYLDESFASNDPAELAASIGTVARAVGMSKVARRAKVSRDSLSRALSRKGNPDLSTIINVLRACGVTLAATAAQAKRFANKVGEMKRGRSSMPAPYCGPATKGGASRRSCPWTSTRQLFLARVIAL
jgi:probable addiction module antidote protein